jgi:hypothetical protein
MKEVSISIDLLCKWREDEDPPPVYRLYVDDDLLTERTYIWRNSDQYIREKIVVYLEPGLHKVKIEPLNPDVNTNKFRITNFVLNKEPYYSIDGQFHID